MRRIDLFLDIAAGLTAAAVLLLVVGTPQATILPWLKALPALFWAASFVVVKPQSWVLMASALVAAALGDYLLGGGTALVAGAAAFAVMQILYSVVFWGMAARVPKPRRLVLAPLLYTMVTALVLILCVPRVGDMAIPIVLYSVLLTAMASGSGAAGGGLLLILGGALFFLSDSVILIFRAWPAAGHGDWAVLVSYYLGQALIVRALRRR